jgi:hypothetical protein
MASGARRRYLWKYISPLVRPEYKVNKTRLNAACEIHAVAEKGIFNSCPREAATVLEIRPVCEFLTITTPNNLTRDEPSSLSSKAFFPSQAQIYKPK